MKIVIDISEHEWEYLNKLVANGDQLGHYERLLVNGEPIVNKALEQEPKTQWIPVSERLPEDGTWNLWTNGKLLPSVERYKLDAMDHFFPDGRWFELEDAVAWMPLPEPYKTESEEK